MGKKTFKVDNRVVGKIRSNLQRLGTVVGVQRGSKQKNLLIRWDNGVEEEVTTRAVDIFRSPGPLPQNAPNRPTPPTDDNSSQESLSQDCSDDDSIASDDVGDYFIFILNFEYS